MQRERSCRLVQRLGPWVELPERKVIVKQKRNGRIDGSYNGAGHGKMWMWNMSAEGMPLTILCDQCRAFYDIIPAGADLVL